MASFNEQMDAAQIIADNKGVNFLKFVEKEKARKLFYACLETKGITWTEKNFASFLVSIGGRAQRKHTIENTPPCPKNENDKCNWRKSKQQEFYTNCRPTAYRVEVMCPQDRCGFLLKDGRPGGDFWDYKPCHNPLKYRGQ